MVIAHNISALNTYKSLGIAGNSMQSSMEKLSSGYKINKAGDDAAGLSISEKMRSQIRGLNQAATNAENGVSMIQTAEGALNEEHSILQRMRELAVQSATDTNAEEDREALQSEIAQLTNEINRIGTTTEFNGMKILDGSKVKKEAIAPVTEQKSTIGAKLALNTAVSVGDEFDFKGFTYVVKSASYDPMGFYNLSFEQKVADDIDNLVIQVDDLIAGGLDVDKSGFHPSVTQLAGKKGNPGQDAEDNSVYFHVGANSNQVINTSFNDMRAKALGISFGEVGANSASTLNVTDGKSTENNEYSLNISTREGANAAIDIIDNAIKLVSEERSKYGAIQNRLEYTINNLNTTAENMTAAESTIRDVDMAEEMMEYTKNNILQQAAQAMLVQANARPQQALQLLQ